ncbi:U3 small nucleolar RNA-associated protein [Corchorus olitorius]|uniref:U3 small nucleolar RNA-associated protein n=1 Tax=Corchorus olitorius TaxID=93759 RepID=A0A1R3KT67_9ROSI|nr:U3 small nucleolar RNA-associated protein [Corchorus olitorius]
MRASIKATFSSLLQTHGNPSRLSPSAGFPLHRTGAPITVGMPSKAPGQLTETS